MATGPWPVVIAEEIKYPPQIRLNSLTPFIRGKIGLRDLRRGPPSQISCAKFEKWPRFNRDHFFPILAFVRSLEISDCDLLVTICEIPTSGPHKNLAISGEGTPLRICQRGAPDTRKHPSRSRGPERGGPVGPPFSGPRTQCVLIDMCVSLGL